MEFINDTNYNKKSLNALNRLAGQTIDPGKKRIYRIVCVVIGALALADGFYLQAVKQMEGIVPSLVVVYGLLLLFLGLFWYQFQYYTSKRMMTRGMQTCHYHFEEDGFSSKTQLTDTSYYYHNLFAISENDNFYALFLDSKHGIIIDKSGFTKGDSHSFASFLEEKSGLTIKKV